MIGNPVQIKVLNKLKEVTTTTTTGSTTTTSEETTTGEAVGGATTTTTTVGKTMLPKTGSTANPLWMMAGLVVLMAGAGAILLGNKED